MKKMFLKLTSLLCLVAIVLSSQLSGTYNNAVAAAEQFAGKVFVVDSLNATAGGKILVEYAN